jgi:hypothetical protein
MFGSEGGIYRMCRMVLSVKVVSIKMPCGLHTLRVTTTVEVLGIVPIDSQN